MKKLLGLGLMLALVVPMAIMLTACGGASGSKVTNVNQILGAWHVEGNTAQVVTFGTGAEFMGMVSGSVTGHVTGTWMFDEDEGLAVVIGDIMAASATVMEGRLSNENNTLTLRRQEGAAHANVVLVRPGTQNDDNNNQQQASPIVGAWTMTAAQVPGFTFTTAELAGTTATFAAGGQMTTAFTGGILSPGQTAITAFAMGATTWSVTGNTLTIGTGASAANYTMAWSNNNNTVTLTESVFSFTFTRN